MQRQLVVILAIGVLAGECAQAENIPEGFRFRRPLQFTQAVSEAPGQNAAWTEFYTNGEAKADGSDLRVTTADGTLVPHKLMQVAGDNDFVRLAFATHGDGPYYAWWGNPKAAAPAKALEIQRGIYAEIFRTPGGAAKDVRTPEGLERLFERAKSPIGSVFVPEIFLAHNPLGEEWDVMFRYRGQFKIDPPVTASLAFTVANSGALKIDGKEIAREIRGGLHARVRDPKEVDLAAGWHTIDVTQVNLDGRQTGVAVVWRKPREKQYTPMPASLFAPIARAIPGPLENVGEKRDYVADFSITPEAEAFAPPEWYLQRYSFEAEFPATFSPKLTWDFGDGQAGSNLKRVNHIFLVPGVYAVTLKVENGGQVHIARRRIAIKDRLYAKFPRPPEDSQKTVAAVLKDYNLSKLTGEQALRGMLYFKGKKNVDSALSWGKAWAPQKDAPGGTAALDEAFELARTLIGRSDFDAAAQLFRDVASKPLPMDQRVELMRYYVRTACDYTEHGGAALKAAQEWKKNVNGSDPRQVTGIRAAILYAAIAHGDVKAAQSLVEEIARDTPAADHRQRQIRQGVLARNIENYIRTKEFDTALKLIDDWEAEFPDAIWEGFTRTLRVKFEVAEGRPAVAARMALQHARANPSGFYAAELLYRAGEHFKAAGDETRAKEAMEILRSRYPESPYARGEK